MMMCSRHRSLLVRGLVGGYVVTASYGIDLVAVLTWSFLTAKQYGQCEYNIGFRIAPDHVLLFCCSCGVVAVSVIEP